MKKLITSAFIILTCLSMTYGQEWDDTCEEAIERANKDFEKGNIKSISYGLIIAPDFEFEDFYDKYLFDKYRITSIDGGCVVTESSECYSSRMDALIKQKYGKNIFKKARKEAEKLYPNKIKSFDDDLTEEELYDVYTIVDTPPQFTGGYDSLFKYVDNQMSNFQLPKKDVEGRSFVGFVIDTNGKPIDVEVIKGYHAEYDSALIKILTKMPDWTPGKRKDQLVKVKLVLPFDY